MKLFKKTPKLLEKTLYDSFCLNVILLLSVLELCAMNASSREMHKESDLMSPASWPQHKPPSPALSGVQALRVLQHRPRGLTDPLSQGRESH